VTTTPRPRLWPEDGHLALLAHPVADAPAASPEAERAARMGLAAIWEPGDRRISQLVAQFGAAPVWDLLRSGDSASGLARRARAVDPERLAHQTEALKLRFIVPGDPEWPGGLTDLDRESSGDLGGAPLGLWLAGPGHLAELGHRCVAIVGDRKSVV
jgi:DNA processing protein